MNNELCDTDSSLQTNPSLPQVCADNWLSHTHDYCPTCTEPVVVALPTRRRTSVKRFNVKEEEPEEPEIVFNLAGSAVKSRDEAVGNNANFINMLSSGVSNARKGVVMSSRRTSRPKTILPSFVDPPASLSVGLSNSTVLPQTPPKDKRTRKPVVSKPPRPLRSTAPEQPSTSGLDLTVGAGTNELRSGAGGSPVDIIRRISSVHDRPSSRSASPKRRGKERRFLANRAGTPDREIQPDLVLVSGVAIS